MRKEYFINLKEDDEIRNYIKKAQASNVLQKHMKEALEQLRISCSEEQCKQWEALIKKIEC